MGGGTPAAGWVVARQLVAAWAAVRPAAAWVVVATTGGGMGGGTTGGGMGGGSTGGGMGGGTTGGGMGGGTTGGGMFGSPAPSFGANNSSDWPGNSAQSSYYTYQCTTPAGVCSFVAPASLRSSSLSAGARCACAVGQPEGKVR